MQQSPTVEPAKTLFLLIALWLQPICHQDCLTLHAGTCMQHADEEKNQSEQVKQLQQRMLRAQL